MEGSCSRCGKQGEVDYGTDGQAYCSSCIFYGTNKPCWRCRMYLPASDLQQYRGQWTCPYCLQDLRFEERKITERLEQKPKLEPYTLHESCERCGKQITGQVYIWNGRRLCKRCLGDEQQKWELASGGPSGAPYRIRPNTSKKKTSLIESIISDFLMLLGLKKERDVIVYETLPGAKPKASAKMPIDAAKPMAEKISKTKFVQSKQEQELETEGLMGGKQEQKAEIIEQHFEQTSSSLTPTKPSKKKSNKPQKPIKKKLKQ